MQVSLLLSYYRPMFQVEQNLHRLPVKNISKTAGITLMKDGECGLLEELI
jgi:hypothetical protein